MLLRAFSLFDLKAGAYAQPFFFSQPGQATRAFSELVNDPGTTVGRHPADFILFELGTFDTDTGAFVSYPVPLHLGLGTNLLGPAPQLELLKAAE